jgi:ribulose-5-phosphate 4-epimerase/fuculose-1-phosphate aldolase
MTKAKNLKKFFYGEEVQRHARVICELARECWELGLSDSTGFSISQIIPGTNIVLTDKSGTGFRRNKITPDDLILISLDGQFLYKPDDSNPRKAPVNVEVHLEGYRNSDAKGCIHWHDPYTNAFSSYGKTIHPLTLQSKLIGDVPCIMVDDRKQKSTRLKKSAELEVPSGFHARTDVYFVMKQVGEEAAKILSTRNKEFERHGIVVHHYEHGLFSFGRSVEEAFENGYRSVRNAQTIIFSRSLQGYPDKRAKDNSGYGDTGAVYG